VISRILVYGVTGSGKTTLPREIAERTGWSASSPGPNVILLRSPRETRRWLARL